MQGNTYDVQSLDGLEKERLLQQDHPSFSMCFDKGSEAAVLTAQCSDAECVHPPSLWQVANVEDSVRNGFGF